MYTAKIPYLTTQSSKMEVIPKVIFIALFFSCHHSKGEETESKKVMLAITVGEKSLFVPEFFKKIQDLDYPKNNLFVHITVQNSTQYHYIKLLTDPWKSTYKSVKIVPSKNPAKAKQEAIHYAKNFKAEFIFFISSVAHLERPDTLKALLKTNTKVVAPFLKTYEKFYYARRLCNVGLDRWLNDSHSFPTLATQKGLREENYNRILIGTNFATKEVLQYRNVSAYNDTAFWITIPQRQKETIEGFDEIDQRSSDLGLKPVDLIRYAYLVKTEVLPERDYRDYFEHENVTFVNTSDSNGVADSIFSQKLQELGIPIFVLNDQNYGQLVNIFDYLEGKVHPELTRLMENHDLWQRRYIIDKVIKTLTQDPQLMPEILPKDTTKPGHCPDTYQMVMFTPTFCEHMIEEAEHEDNWFLSGNAAVYDARNKRKESVPTTDINLWQYGLEEMWMAFINFYLYPRKCTFYPGHPGLDLGGHFFTVRYRWEEQPALKPHHDNSLYSINIALNQIGKDFEGGGTHFLRQNCSELTMDTGTMMVHPGRVTHFHEGLSTTSGTRYIMISFVNAAYPCYERNGVPYCNGFVKNENFEAELKRHSEIARINEGYKETVDVKV